MKKLLLCCLFTVFSMVLLNGQQLPFEELGRVFNSPKLPAGSLKVKEAILYKAEPDAPGDFRKINAYYYDVNGEKTKAVFYTGYHYGDSAKRVIEYSKNKKYTIEYEYQIIPPGINDTMNGDRYDFKWEQRKTSFTKDSLCKTYYNTKYFDNSKILTTYRVFNKKDQMLEETYLWNKEAEVVQKYKYDSKGRVTRYEITEDGFTTIDFFDKNGFAGRTIYKGKHILQKEEEAVFWFPYTSLTEYAANGDSVPNHQKIYTGNNVTAIHFYKWAPDLKARPISGSFLFHYPPNSATPADCYRVEKSDTVEWIHITTSGDTSSHYHINRTNKPGITISLEKIITPGKMNIKNSYVKKELTTTDSIAFYIKHPELFLPESVIGTDSAAGTTFHIKYKHYTDYKHVDSSVYDARQRVIRSTYTIYISRAQKADSVYSMRNAVLTYLDTGKSYILRGNDYPPLESIAASRIYNGNLLLHADSTTENWSYVLNYTYDRNSLLLKKEYEQNNAKNGRTEKYTEEITYTPENQVLKHSKVHFDRNNKEKTEFIIQNIYADKLPFRSIYTDQKGIEQTLYKVEYTYY